MGGLILDLFAGPGGWSEGLRSLGLSDVGIEWDAAACQTRSAAGHATIRADVAQYPTGPFVGRVEGLIASPPCQEFSSANGKRKGLESAKGQLVYEVMRWANDLRPSWIACEQVVAVLPIWKSFADLLSEMGYSAWAGTLCAADYGVPQERYRAFLIAHRSELAQPPAPTHGEAPGEPMFDRLLPWVSMADGLGWGERPGWVVNTRQRSLKGGRRTEDYRRSVDRPSPTLTVQAGGFWQWEKPSTTVCGDPRITARCHHDFGSQGRSPKTTEQVRAGDYEGTEPIKLTIDEALTLQGFDVGYPVQGSRTKQFEQVGNAIPPPLAAAVIGSLLAFSRTSPAGGPVAPDGTDRIGAPQAADGAALRRRSRRAGSWDGALGESENVSLERRGGSDDGVAVRERDLVVDPEGLHGGDGGDLAAVVGEVLADLGHEDHSTTNPVRSSTTNLTLEGVSTGVPTTHEPLSGGGEA